MKIYGWAQKGDVELKLLGETTVVAEPDALRDLASFLNRGADAIEDQGDSWEHEPFESNEEVSTQFVVLNPDVVDE